MQLTCELVTEQPYEQMQQLFKTELERKHERSSITLQDRQGKAVFNINAQDTTSLRAAMNTITSILGMYEKSKEALNGRQ